MTNNERKALLTYLDSQVMSLCKSIEDHLDPDAIGTLYDSAHNLIKDMEDILLVDAMLQAAAAKPELPAKRKSS